MRSAGGDAVAVKGSVSEECVRHQLVKAAVQLSPAKQIDMLVHNAGNGDDKYLVDLDEDFFDMQVGINLKGRKHRSYVDCLCRKSCTLNG